MRGLQTRIPEGAAHAPPGGVPNPGIQPTPRSPALQAEFFALATWEVSQLGTANSIHFVSLVASPGPLLQALVLPPTP